MNIAEIERASSLDLIDTRCLLMHVLRCTRVQLITCSNYVLNTEEIACINQYFSRRINGEPIAYLVGAREFFGLTFQVTPDVLIPRPDTELLVELALEFAKPHAKLLDMGTGSGAIAISLAHTRKDLQVSACDLSTSALAIAQKNAQQLLTENAVKFSLSDWYTAFSGQRFDVIVSNPPYIVQGDPHLTQGDLRFEPINALTDHHDGLSAYRHIIKHAKEHLNANGRVLVEHGYNQASEVRALFAAHGFQETQSWRDLAGIERVTGAVLV